MRMRLLCCLGLAVLMAPFLRQEKGKTTEKMEKDIVAVKPSGIKWEKADGMPEGLMVSHLTGEPSAAPFVDMLKSPVRQLRLAALAGLERIADPHTRRAVEWATVDPDYEVREFADRALRALPRP